MLWEDWLNRLRQLPADADEWDQSNVDQFVLSVRELASLATMQRSLNRVQSAICELQNAVPREHLVLLEMDVATDWKSEDFVLDHESEIIQYTSTLVTLVRTHFERSQAETQVPLVERRWIREEISELELQIVDAFEHLQLLRKNADVNEDSSKDSHVPPSSTESMFEPRVEVGSDASSHLDLPEDAGSIHTPASEEIDTDPPTLKTGLLNDPALAINKDPIDDRLSQIIVESASPEVRLGVGPRTSSQKNPAAERERVPLDSVENNGPRESVADSQQNQVQMQERRSVHQEDSETSDMADDDNLQITIPTEATESIPEALEDFSQIDDVPLSNRTSLDIANRLLSDSIDDTWHTFVWKLIADGDLAGAYWVTRARESKRQSVPVPSWIIKAVQGSQWLEADTRSIASDLIEIINSHPVDSHDPAMVLLSLSAALTPPLVAPEVRMMDWLLNPSDSTMGTIALLAEHVRQFSFRVTTIEPQDLEAALSVEQRENQLRAASRDAQQWLSEAKVRRTAYQPATLVLHALAQSADGLLPLLETVAKNDRNALKIVEDELSRWRDENWANNRLDRIHRNLIGSRSRGKRIQAGARRQLLREIAAACDLAQTWVRHARALDISGTDRDWIYTHIEDLRHSVRSLQDDLEGELDELTSSNQPRSVQASAICLRRSIGRLLDLLRLPVSVNFRHESPLVLRGAKHDQAPKGVRLDDALARRLLWLPQAPLEDDGTAPAHLLPKLDAAVRDDIASSNTLSQVIDNWAQAQDFRFLFSYLLPQLDNTERSRKEEEVREQILGARAEYGRQLRRMREEIEQAVIDGTIAEHDRSRFLTHIEHNESGSDLDFRRAYEQLERIRALLAQSRKDQIEALTSQWRAIESQLHLITPTDSQSADDSASENEIREYIESALKQEDVRIASEMLAEIASHVSSGRSLSRNRVATHPAGVEDEAGHLERFHTKLTEIETFLYNGRHRRRRLDALRKGVRDGKKIAGINFGSLPHPIRNEASDALGAWQRLKSDRPGELQQGSLGSTKRILGFLGFTIESDSDPIEQCSFGRDWMHIRIRMSSGPLARPIPQFGSEAGGVYDVVCLWERPNADRLHARLQELRLVSSSIVIYLGRITQFQRQELLNQRGTSDSRPFLLLDETLLLYLCGLRDARLPALLECSLVYTRINPYRETGSVPSEMFFGRRSMRAQILDPSGSCVVYGGRQLGKSALLHDALREFMDPVRKQYAWILDLQIEYDPISGRDANHLWQTLAERLREVGLLSGRMSRTETIHSRIRQAFEEDPSLRIIVMFDEADRFLDDDADSNDCREVARFRTLMTETNRRFKAVFVGLHDVQRFWKYPNHPLAHFGPSICVGPLEPDAALDLIRVPLKVLGYQFDSPTTANLILSYTNSHPGLLQLFCRRLLEHLIRSLKQRGSASALPLIIDREDIEAVYRNQKVRDDIRDRFLWTLRLDSRYEAIVLALVFDQLVGEGSVPESHTASEVVSLVQGFWESGFQDESTEDVRILLQELVGLGILTSSAQGRYSLRSPNLVRLMGSADAILEQMTDLSILKVSRPSWIDSYHALLSDQERFSPFTFSQERGLNFQEFGYAIIGTSEALGTADLSAALRRFVLTGPQHDSRELGVFEEIQLGDARALPKRLDRLMSDNPDCEQFIALIYPDVNTSENLVALIDAAKNFCRQRQQSKKRWMSVMFVLDPSRLWLWAQVPDNVRSEIEDLAKTIITPALWHEKAIIKRLEQLSMMATEGVSSTLLHATGGWHFLLDLVMRHSGGDDPRSAANKVYAELGDTESDIRNQFVSALGIDVSEMLTNVLETLAMLEKPNKPIPLEIARSFLEAEGLDVEESWLRAAREYLRRMRCIREDIDGNTGELEVIIDPIVHRALIH